MSQIVHADIRPIVTSQLFQVLTHTTNVLLGNLKLDERLIIFVPIDTDVWQGGAHFIARRDQTESFDVWLSDHRSVLCSITVRKQVSFVDVLFLIVKEGAKPPLSDFALTVPSGLVNELLRAGIVCF